MEVKIKSTSPDGLIVTYETFFHTWDDVLEFLKKVNAIEFKIDTGG